MLPNRDQPVQAADGSAPGVDLIAMRRKVDRISLWLFRRIPLGALSLLVVYIGLRLADSSGRQQWRVDAPKDKSFRTLVASQGRAHALRTDGVCQTFDVRTGEQAWETRLCEEFNYDARVALSNDLLLVTSFEGLWVLDPAKGTVLYKQDRPSGPEQIAMVDRRLLIAEDTGIRLSWRHARGRDATNAQDNAAVAQGPSLTCVDFSSGRLAWTRPFNGRRITHLAGANALCACASEVPQSWEWKPCAKHQKVRMRYGDECADCVSRWIPASDRRIDVLDTTTGLTQWHCELKGGDVRHIAMNTGRIVVLTNQRIYAVGADGREIGRMQWSSSNLTQTIFSSDHVMGVAEDGAIRAAAVAPPAPAWSFSPGGLVHHATVGGNTVYVYSIESGDSADRNAGDAAPSAHAQLTRELWGEGEDGDPGAGGTTRRVLSALNEADGSTRWRKSDILGRIVPYDDMFLRITEGYETQLLFPDGGTVIYAHLARNGRQVWYRKIPFAVHDMVLLPDRIVAVLEKRTSGMFGPGNLEQSAIVSYNRRSLLNRLMRP